MNNKRRKELAAINDRIRDIAELLEAVKGDLENVRDEERDYRENMPESLQSSDKAYAADEVVSTLEDAISALEDFDAESIGSSIEDASQ